MQGLFGYGRYHYYFCFLALNLLLALEQHAVASDSDDKYKLIVAANMLDVTSGEIIRDPRVLIKNNLIVSINPDTLPRVC
ncbi:hypothetical protein [uncultured Shewanella sp.]|uniref:hypothetical protein n=1 Tax=uncultured Shewanella sp. TaxID=173975 RepID=UPI002605DAD8|nr:hypothetical protein [uncultured Shewanella sp.]